MSSYVGLKHGLLTVVEDLGCYLKQGTSRKRHWLKCRCDCGNEIIITLDSFKSGKTKSCGCYRRNRIGQESKKHNNYYIDGTITYIQYSNCNEYFIIDTEDFDKIKDVCWYKDKDGYAVNKTGDKFLMVHRIIMDTKEDFECDHINRKTYDNRKCNLRNVTHRQNNLNKGLCSRNTSGYTGISFNKKRGKWFGQITASGNHIFLGSFDNIKDAIRARQEAEIKYFGEFRGCA